MKNIIVRLANGLGNQLFTYAAAFNLAKKNNANLLIDDESGFYKRYKFELNKFKLNAQIAENKFKYKGQIGRLKRKIYKNFKFLKKDLIFIEEKKDKNKFTKFDSSIFNIKFDYNAYVEGYFQSEKYFKSVEKLILKEFDFNDEIKNKSYKFKDLILKNNSISIHIRKNKFLIDENHNDIEALNSENLNINLETAKKGIKFFENKFENTMFFVWSDDFTGLRDHFPSNKFIFIDENINLSPIYDLYLMSLCKNFIISPSTFHYWASFLSKNPNKICLSPPFIKNKSGYYGFSNNQDIRPDWWV